MNRAGSPAVTGRYFRRSLAARQAGLFVALAVAQTLAIALALPHAGIAPLIAIATPAIAVTLVITVATPRGERRAAWAGIGLLRRPTGRGVLVAIVGPAAITALSFAAAAAVGVARFPNLNLAPGAVASGTLKVTGTLIIFTVVFIGEEMGWRGYLLPRLAELMPGRHAAVLTGACHAIFHLPLLLLTTTYQFAGNRLVVVPMVMLTLTLAGVWYGWLRAWTGSIWPVSLSHSAFNIFMETAGAAAVATSPAALAYVTTETGIVTLILVALVSAWLLIRRSADFDKIKTENTIN